MTKVLIGTVLWIAWTLVTFWFLTAAERKWNDRWRSPTVNEDVQTFCGLLLLWPIVLPGIAVYALVRGMVTAVRQ